MQSLRNRVSEKISVGDDSISEETRFLGLLYRGLLQSLRNRVSDKISVGDDSISEETRFLGIFLAKCKV